MEEVLPRRFRGQVIYITSADVTLRRPSGAILVIDNYEIACMSDGNTRFDYNQGAPPAARDCYERIVFTF